MSTASTLRAGWRRGQRGWPERFPVAQFPNAPLLVALAASVVARLTHGSVHSYARGAFYVGLAAWAWLEMTAGTNWFRRGLGAAGLVYVVAKISGSP